MNLSENLDLNLIRTFLARKHLAKLLPNEHAEKCHKQFRVTANVKQAIMTYTAKHVMHILLLLKKTLCKV